MAHDGSIGAYRQLSSHGGENRCAQEVPKRTIHERWFALQHYFLGSLKLHFGHSPLIRKLADCAS